MHRHAFAAIFLICFFALTSAYILQYGFGQKPCDLCLLQRVFFYAVGLTAGLAYLARPGLWGSRIYSSFCLLFSLCGLGAAGRQVYLQNLPEELKPGCGPGLLFRMHHSPWLDALGAAIKGTGDCAQIGWTFFGLSLAVWSGVIFVVLLLMNIYALQIKKVVH